MIVDMNELRGGGHGSRKCGCRQIVKIAKPEHPLIAGLGRPRVSPIDSRPTFSAIPSSNEIALWHLFPGQQPKTVLGTVGALNAGHVFAMENGFHLTTPVWTAVTRSASSSVKCNHLSIAIFGNG